MGSAVVNDRPTTSKEATMKTRRTRTIRLALMGSVGLVGTLPLAGCDEAPEADAFRTVQECIAKTGQELSCREAERAAQTLAAESAPAFRSQAACEASFGNCAPAPRPPTTDQVNAGISSGDAVASPATGSWFMPAAAGFLLGRAMGGGAGLPFFQSRQYGAVGFGPGGQRLGVDPNAFANQREREQQARSTGSAGRGSRSYYSTTTRTGSSSVTASPSRTGGFGTTARSSSSSSSS
jgi:uncharacterized protein YgiB involved in biofilm formation